MRHYEGVPVVGADGDAVSRVHIEQPAAFVRAKLGRLSIHNRNRTVAVVVQTDSDPPDERRSTNGTRPRF